MYKSTEILLILAIAILLMTVFGINFVHGEEIDIRFPKLIAVLTEEGDLLIYGTSPITIDFLDYNIQFEMETQKIEDFYIPHEKPNFFIRYIACPITTTSIMLVSTAILSEEKPRDYFIFGSIGLGAGILLDIIINRSIQ